jgi:hypothetical protein
MWGFKDAASMSLPIRYKSFFMDIGMYGNALSLNYNHFSIFATNGTWFKNVWELLHKFKTIASFGIDTQIHPVQEGD